MNSLMPFEELFKEMPSLVRLQRLVDVVQETFQSGAVALLKLENDSLKPITAKGLVAEALGRKFTISQHPRLSALMNSSGALRFPLDSPLPDPYDGLIADQPGTALPVHDCMGIQLNLKNKCWGLLTLDSLTPGTFNAQSLEKLERYRPIIEAIIRLSIAEEEMVSLQKDQFNFANNLEHTYEHDLDIVGSSDEIKQILKELEIIAPSELPVLLLGETGVGKDIFAHFLHRKSKRSHNPLIYVNCATLTADTADSELFGHIKGAFSGAVADRKGRIEGAHLGTIFLDEIGLLSLPIQAKILRLLQTGELERLGSNKSIKVDIRFITATNRNLKKLVVKGDFRADLFHRLSVYPIPIPPLRERPQDISLLTGYFLELNRSRLGVRSLRLSEDAETALLSYPWPGNIRELEHAIRRAAVKTLSAGAKPEDIITLDSRSLDLQLPNQFASQFLTVDNDQSLFTAVEGMAMKDAVKSFQKALILKELENNEGSWSATARALKLDPSNLHKLAVKIGLK